MSITDIISVIMSITDIISVIMSITDIISVIMSITDIISVIMSITDIISVVTSVALPLRDVAVRRVACVLLHSAKRRRIHAILTSMIAQTEQHAWSSRGASIAAQVHLLQHIDPASIAAQVHLVQHIDPASIAAQVLVGGGAP
jgi:hypothetical protein